MKNIAIYLFVLVFITSCTNNPYVKDVSDVSVSYTIDPFYKDIFNLANNFTEKKRIEISKKYGVFFESFNTKVLKIGNSVDSGYAKRLNSIMNEKWMQDLYSESDKIFNKDGKLDIDLTEALQYYSYHFPNKKLPKICAFIAGVQYSVVIDSNMIAIGIDKYLGPKYEMYSQMQVASFIKRNMYKEKISSDVMRALVENEFPNSFTEEYLLSKMIQQGRYMYFVKCMLPDVHDSLIWGYTGRQLEFCEKSEGEFWEYFVSTEGLLFNSDYMASKRFLDDGPFTPVFSRESPGKIGQWIGFKIVESYMKQNPKVSLEQLFAIESAQEIMKKAKYNP